jgi:thiol-disulfide isomerase/thioredoxin
MTSSRVLRRFVLTVAVTCPSLMSAQESGIAVGSAAPNATIETIDGRSVQLSQWVGRQPVVLEFWASWCSSCKALEPELKRAAERYAPGVKFIGIAVSANQTPERVRRFLQQHPMPVEMLYDRTGTAVDAYSVPATSYIVVIDRRGRVVYTGSGGGQDLITAVRRGL